MEQTPNGWTVIDRERAVLMREYTFAKNAVANTFVTRMGDGTLAVVSPAAGVSDGALSELAQFGEVGALIANNGFHYLGQNAWRQRFPKARCFAPVTAIERIKKKSAMPLPFEPLSALEAGPDVGFREVPNTKAGESWCWAKAGDGYAWFTSDVLANMPRLPPFPISLLFKWTKSAPGFRVFNLALKFIVKDRAATLRLLQSDLEAHSPTVLVPGHGRILDGAGLANEARTLIASYL